jgi:predicted nucleic acid-binding protein
MPVPKRLLLDTDIVIQLLKKRSDVLECFIGLHEQGVEFYLSPIVIAEIYVGAFKKEHPEIEAFFNLCTRWTLDAKTLKRQNRRGCMHSNIVKPIKAFHWKIIC